MDTFRFICDLVTLGLLLAGVRQMVRPLRGTARTSAKVRRALRISRVGTATLGLGIIAWCLVLSIEKVVHIYTAPSAPGTVTTVQKSSHYITPYSFYVKFTTAQGQQRREYAFTSVLFSKAEGDSVTVLYDPVKRHSTEVVAFDSDWLLYLLGALGGLLIVLFAGWMYGWRDPQPLATAPSSEARL